MKTNGTYLGNASLHEVVIRIQKEVHGITIQLFRAHTSEPYGELRIPPGHAGALAQVLAEHARGDTKPPQTKPENT